MGARVPLAVRWGNNIRPSRRIKDFVSFTDLAPTFLELAGLNIPETMSGKSLVPLLQSNQQGWICEERDYIIFGKERHVPAQKAPSMDGYPCRALRTADYLYIYNFKPERWPAGVPEGSTHPMNSFADCDNGPTKTFITEHGSDPDYKKYYDWCFGKRPAEELYKIADDPDQLHNLAGKQEYENIRQKLHDLLMNSLRDAGDPRVIGGGDEFDKYLYRAGYTLRK